MTRRTGMIPMRDDVIVRRPPDPGGPVSANVPLSVVCHSPTGWECGYAGSGPADLAFNIVNAFVPPGSDGEPVEVYQQGEASATAARLYQQFKDEFIVGLRLDPGESGLLPASEILSWIEVHAWDALSSVQKAHKPDLQPGMG